MRKIFQYILNQFTSFFKNFFKEKTIVPEKQNPRSNTDFKAYLSMLMAFDFTAYFDDNELENNAEDISKENPLPYTSAEGFCINDKECPYTLSSF
jgi:hypothetical protein